MLSAKSLLKCYLKVESNEQGFKNLGCIFWCKLLNL